MTLQRAGQYLFVLYCTTVGVALVLVPWSPGWEQLVGSVPFAQWLHFLVRPASRGALTGFGFVHLVWGLYELRDFLTYRLEHARADSPDHAIPVAAPAASPEVSPEVSPAHGAPSPVDGDP